jgi:YgiT-type zinc finger domain-containing protein
MTTKKRAKPTTQELCPICGGALKPGTITHTEQDEHGRFYIFQHVPALICQTCGEYLLDADTIDKLDALTESGTPTAKVEAPVFDLAIA